MARKSFVSGAIILMVAGFIVRIFGFVYRIYLSNLIGAEGMGVFQLISPIYTLIILTLTSGISIAVSQMVAREQACGRYINLLRITRCALLTILVIGAIVSCILLLNINFLVNVIIKDSRTYYSMLLLIPCIPIICAASALKGYFYGIQEVTPTAVSQVVEQIVKIGLVISMAQYFLKIGLEYACALATIGMAIGEISNCFVLWIVFYIKRKKTFFKSKAGLMRKRKVISEILRISAPVSFNRFITSIMTAIEVIMIPRRLLSGGLDYQSSIEAYGRLTGMAMPLIYFPSLVTSSLATTLVPAISEAVAQKNTIKVNNRISKSIQYTFILGFIFMSVFMTYPKQIGDLFYRKENVGDILYYLSFTCIFTYLQQTLTGIMNGLGKQGISLQNSIIGSAIRIAFVYFVVPSEGIKGYVAGLVISMACVCVLNLIVVTKITGMVIDIRNWIIKPGIVGLIMYAISKYIYSFFTIFNMGYKLTVVAAVFGNVIIAISLMVMLGAAQKQELLALFGAKKR